MMMGPEPIIMTLRISDRLGINIPPVLGKQMSQPDGLQKSWGGI
jgi:hypothetical protein